MGCTGRDVFSQRSNNARELARKGFVMLVCESQVEEAKIN